MTDEQTGGAGTKPAPATDESQNLTRYVILTSTTEDGATFIVRPWTVKASGQVAAKRAAWEHLKADGWSADQALHIAPVPARSWDPQRLVERPSKETQLVMESPGVTHQSPIVQGALDKGVEE